MSERDTKSLMTRFAGERWAMEPGYLKTFIAELSKLAAGVTEGGAASGSSDPLFSRTGATALIAITGVILRDVPGWIKEWFDVCDVNDIGAALSEALGDPSIDSIMLRVDSPGGTVSGIEDLCDRIFAARDVKPICAHVDDLAASGAYWLASQAQRVTAVRTASVGSIGCYTVLYDQSGYADQIGVKVRVVRSGPFKGTGVPGAEITDPELVPFQEAVDAITEIFVGAVARGRGMDVESVRELATGRSWMAEAAAALGLIDGVETVESALAGGPPSDIVAGGDQYPEQADSEHKETEMNEEVLTLESLRRDHGDFVEAIAEEARIAERERIIKIHQVAGNFADMGATATDQVAKGRTPEEAAMIFAAVHGARRSQQIEDLEKEVPADVEQGDVDSEDVQAKKAKKAGESQTPKEAWDSDEALRAEFNDDFEAYKAFEHAEKKGLVKVYKGARDGEGE